MSELLNCPFCGGTDLRQDIDETWVRCRCGAEGPGASNGSQKRGRELWNTRADADRLAALQAKLEEAKGALRVYAEDEECGGCGASLSSGAVARAALTKLEESR